MRGIIPILCCIALLLLTMAGVSAAAEPEMWLWGPGGTSADIGREVLWLDNPDFDASAGSSEIIGAVGLETEIANDLLLETDATIEKVTWWGKYWGWDGPPISPGFNLRFYYGANCLPEADPFVEYIIEGDAGQTLAEGGDMMTQYVYEHCICLPLSAGAYWFAVQMGDHEYPPQWGRQGADVIQLCESAFRSVFFAYPEWVPCQVAFGLPYEASQMFQDECVPTAVENASWGAVKGLFR